MRKLVMSFLVAIAVIIPFATSGGSDYGDTEKDLKVSAPNAIFRPGKVLNNATDSQVTEWVKTVK